MRGNTDWKRIYRKVNLIHEKLQPVKLLRMFFWRVAFTALIGLIQSYQATEKSFGYPNFLDYSKYKFYSSYVGKIFSKERRSSLVANFDEVLEDMLELYKNPPPRYKTW